ncbi:MAG: AMP-binding protein, partial [Bacillota bacterium]
MPELYSVLQEQGRRRGDAPAIWHCRGAAGSTQTTFRALAAAAAKFASCFHRHAAEAPIVPMLLGKSADCVAAMMGANGAGKAFACLNPKLRWPQVNQILQGLGQTIGLCD